MTECRFVEGGSLSDAKKKFGNWPEKLVARYICQLLQGLAYLHAQGIVHRDIKGANLLSTKEVGSGAEWKLTGAGEGEAGGLWRGHPSEGRWAVLGGRRVALLECADGWTP